MIVLIKFCQAMGTSPGKLSVCPECGLALCAGPFATLDKIIY